MTGILVVIGMTIMAVAVLCFVCRPRKKVDVAEVIMARWRAEQEAYERYKDRTWVGVDLPIDALKESLGESGEAWMTDSEGKIR